MVAAWSRSTFLLGMLGGMLLWIALPPLGLWPVAWLAPIGWVMLIRAEQLPRLPAGGRPHWLRPSLLAAAAAAWFAVGMAANAWFHSLEYRGYWMAEVPFWSGLLVIVCAAAWAGAGRPYFSLWLAGTFFWLAALHWLRLPYWAVGFGWLALGVYFGCYLPVFIGLSRVAVHTLRLPVILVAPAVWAGMELAQAYLLTGMTMGCLGHTQYRWTGLIQVCDLTGSYGISFIVMFVAACFARMLPVDGRRPVLWPLAPAAALLVAVLSYGHWRIAKVETAAGLKIALIQGNIDIQLNETEEKRTATARQYVQLTLDAIARFPQIDLVIWPETVFYCPWVTADAEASQPPGFESQSEEQFQAELAAEVKQTRDELTRAARYFRLPMVLGVNRRHFSRGRYDYFNTAVLVTPDDQWHKRRDRDPPEDFFYDKMHLVMFGEYVPFARDLPWLQYVTPLGIGSSMGRQPAGLVLNDICLAPNICYESTLPHVIRHKLVELRRRSLEPDILVNLTNDGWFWGSSELDMHLACGVFRTIECRRPMVIAANTGVSAWIDGNGRILAEGKRHATDLILADVRLDRRESWYLRHGDWFAGTCLTLVIGLAGAGGVRAMAVRRGGRRQETGGRRREGLG